MPRQRNVYPTDRIAHLWAHQTQPSARNPQRNLYFEGTVLYSYRDSYPIGNLITIGKGKSQQTVVLLQEDHYSAATAKHCSLANRATTHMQQFRVPYVVPRWGNVDVDHAANLKWYAEKVASKVASASKARQSAMWKYDAAYAQWEESVTYAKLFKQPKPISPIKDWQAFRDECSKREQRAVALANDPTLDPKRYAARMKREAAKQAKRDAWIAEQTAKIADSIAKWRTGELRSMPYFERPPDGLYTRRESWQIRTPTMLRITGNEVETSRGATFPVSHAKRGLALVRSVMARGEDWHSNGHTCKLGHYQIQSITADGTVTAGCHVVTWPEIAAIADQLDAISTEVPASGS